MGDCNDNVFLQEVLSNKSRQEETKHRLTILTE